MEIEQNIWGFTEQGEAVLIYKMINSAGAYVTLTNIGAAIVGIGVPDRDGKIGDVALGFRDFRDYFGDSAYLGKTCGRVANRIAKGRFALNGVEYKLPVNNGPNHLHGGPEGLAEKLWQSRVETNRIVFSYVSTDGEGRYPGTVGIETVYDWNDDCELEITYYARTDHPTILNLTNHVYFNLQGEGCGDILSHELQLNASHFLSTDRTSIPLGELAPVAGTPMDFRTPKPVGRDIASEHPQIVYGNGYDHFWVLDGWQKGRSQHAGRLYDPRSGRKMDLFTTYPGLMFYSGNYLDGIGKNKKGDEYTARGGMALECQYHPDAPNHPDFPSIVLDPDESYEEHIVFKFGVE